MYFTTCSLPPVCTFGLLPKSDDVVTFYRIYLHFQSLALFIYLPLLQTTVYVPLDTSPTFRVYLAIFHRKISFRPYLCFYLT
jgi:hypothetical protein